MRYAGSFLDNVQKVLKFAGQEIFKDPCNIAALKIHARQLHYQQKGPLDGETPFNQTFEQCALVCLEALDEIYEVPRHISQKHKLRVYIGKEGIIVEKGSINSTFIISHSRIKTDSEIKEATEFLKSMMRDIAGNSSSLIFRSQTARNGRRTFAVENCPPALFDALRHLAELNTTQAPEPTGKKKPADHSHSTPRP